MARPLRIGKRKLVMGNHKSKIGNRMQYAGEPPDEKVIEFPGPDISWQAEWKEFVSAIREGREPLGNGKDGLEANRMIETVYTDRQEKTAPSKSTQ